MDNIVNKEQLFEIISEVRNASDHFTTNFFWDDDKHQQWINDGNLWFEYVPCKCLFLLHKDEGFCYLFYAASNPQSLSNALKNLQFQGVVSVDIVTKTQNPKELEIFKEYGYLQRRRLYRMVRTGAYSSIVHIEDKNILYATNVEIPKIREILLGSFDKLSEQIPSNEELKRLVNSKSILIYTLENEIAGLLLYQTTGRIWHLRYWFVNQKYRNHRIGSKLFRYALSESRRSIKQILWVADDNDNAIIKYEHYGFRKDNLYDFVMIKGE